MFHIFLDCLLKQERNLILTGEYVLDNVKNFTMGRLLANFPIILYINYAIK